MNFGIHYCIGLFQHNPLVYNLYHQIPSENIGPQQLSRVFKNDWDNPNISCNMPGVKKNHYRWNSSRMALSSIPTMRCSSGYGAPVSQKPAGVQNLYLLPFLCDTYQVKRCGWKQTGSSPKQLLGIAPFQSLASFNQLFGGGLKKK